MLKYETIDEYSTNDNFFHVSHSQKKSKQNIRKYLSNKEKKCIHGKPSAQLWLS